MAVITGAVSAFTAIFSSVDKTRAELAALFPKSFPPQIIQAASFVVVALSLLWFFRARGRSRLLHPDRLRLDASNPDHLFGRRDVVRRLHRFCLDHPQIHLIGPSGSGKSAVLKGGLIRSLSSSPLLPVYIETWGIDPERGPSAALSQAIWESLPEECRQKLNLNIAPAPDDAFAVLIQIRSKCGRKPILIFDQFDDYQIRHRKIFINRKNTWIRPKKLVASIQFFRSVRELLEAGTIHCLFATRADNAAGLESVRFKTPVVYNLDNLSSATVKGLIQDITRVSETDSPVIERPDRGWDRLAARLVDDLAADGTILAAQMRLALLSMAELDALTISAYDRAGGLEGLEAKYIEGQIANSARAAGLPRVAIRRLLLDLVDQESGEIAKTVSRPFGFIKDSLLPWAVSEGKLQVVLEDLTFKEVIRKRINPDARQDEYSLCHDYLSTAVREVEARANRPAMVLKESEKSFRAAAGIVERWNALLSIRQLFSIFVGRARRQIRFRGSKYYIALSLLRPLVVTLMVACVAAAFRHYYVEDENRSEALDLIESLDWRTESPSPTELRSLWQLAQKSPNLKIEFVELALSGKRNSIRFTRRRAEIARALTGLDPSLRKTIEGVVLKRIQERAPVPSVRTACVALGAELEINDSQFLDFAAANTLDAINDKSRDGSERMDAVAAGMQSFSRMNAAERKLIVDSLLSRLLESVGEADYEQWLRRPFRDTPFIFDQDQFERTDALIFGQLFSGSKYMRESPASVLSQTVIGHFSQEQRRKLFAALLNQLAAALRSPDTEWQVAKIDAVLQDVGTSENLPERHAVLASVLSLLRNAQSSSEPETAVQNIGYLPMHFTKAEAASATAELVHFVDISFGDPVRINPGMSIVESSMQRMDQDDSAEFAHLLIQSARKRFTLPGEGEMFVNQVARLRPLMADAQRHELDAVTAMSQTDPTSNSVPLTTDYLIELLGKYGRRGPSASMNDDTVLSLVTNFTVPSEGDARRLAEQLISWNKSRIGSMRGPMALASVMHSPLFPTDESLRERCFETIATAIVNDSGYDFSVRDDELAALRQVPGEWGGPGAIQLLAAFVSLPTRIGDGTNRPQRLLNMEREVQAILPKVRSSESGKLTELILRDVRSNADNVEVLKPLIRLLSAMPAASNVREIADILKFPSIAGSSDKAILSILERDLHQSFGDNVWTFAEWAKNHPEVGLSRPLAPLSTE